MGYKIICNVVLVKVTIKETLIVMATVNTTTIVVVVFTKRSLLQLETGNKTAASCSKVH